MKHQQILTTLFDDKTVRVLDKLLEKTGVFYLRELAKEADVSLATTFRIVQRLLGLGLVEKQMRQKFVYYNVKADVPVFDELYTLLKGKKTTPLEAFCDRIKPLEVQAYLDKGNKLFLVGDISEGWLKPAINELNKGIKKYKHMVVKEDQFKQMAELGLVDKNVKQLV